MTSTSRGTHRVTLAGRQVFHAADYCILVRRDEVLEEERHLLLFRQTTVPVPVSRLKRVRLQKDNIWNDCQYTVLSGNSSLRIVTFQN